MSAAPSKRPADAAATAAPDITVAFITRIANVALPLGSPRRAHLVRAARGFGVLGPPASTDYQYWIENVEPYLFGPAIRLVDGDAHPSFSVVVPVYNGTPDRYLQPMVTSVINQSYGRWELIIADATTLPDRRAAVARVCETDHRVRRVDVAANLGISGNTNVALSAATCDWVAFLDHDDTLSPHALNELALAVVGHPGCHLVYSDEDKLLDSGDRRARPHLKSDFSPDLILNVNYITHFTAVRRDVLEEVGLLRPEFDGAQDYELLLRLIRAAPSGGIVHVPKVLYHWREAPTSTAANFGVKSSALDAGVRAISEHLHATSRPHDSVTAIDNRPGFYRVRHHVPPGTTVTLMLAGIHDVPAAQARLERLLRRGTPPLVTQIISDVALHLPHRPHPLPGTDEPLPIVDVGRNFDAACVAAHATGDVIVYLGGPATPDADDWTEDLTGALLQPHVFAVAPRIVSPGKQVVDMGLVAIDDHLVPLVHGSPDVDSPFGTLEWVRNVDALSGRAFAIRRVDLVLLDESAVKPTEGNPHPAPFPPRRFLAAARNAGRLNLVWSHQSCTITGTALAETRWFNPQLYRLGGTLTTSKGFDESFRVDGGPLW